MDGHGETPLISLQNLFLGNIVPVLRQGGWCDGILLAILQIERDLLETGGCKHITACCRTDGIEAHRREDIPSRHLSCVIIARESSRGIIILSIENMGHTFNGLLTLANEIIEVGYLVAGLIAMPVPALSK